MNNNQTVEQVSNTSFPLFKSYPEIKTYISKKRDGFMRLKPSGNVRIDEISRKNRKKYISKIGIDSHSLVSASLARGTNIAVVKGSDQGKTVQNYDGRYPKY